MAPSRWRTSFS